MSGNVADQLQRKIKFTLLKNKKECEKKLQDLIREAKGSLHNSDSSYSNHPADRATSICIPLTRIPNLRKLIVKYDEALERLGKGTYGICKDCNKPIPLARLEKVPLADRCVICKEAAELADTIPLNGGFRLSRQPAVMV